MFLNKLIFIHFSVLISNVANVYRCNPTWKRVPRDPQKGSWDQKFKDRQFIGLEKGASFSKHDPKARSTNSYVDINILNFYTSKIKHKQNYKKSWQTGGNTTYNNGFTVFTYEELFRITKEKSNTHHTKVGRKTWKLMGKQCNTQRPIYMQKNKLRTY